MKRSPNPLLLHIVPPPHPTPFLFATVHSFIDRTVLLLGISRKSPVPAKKEEDKKPHIKKPLNAFMLYMKEMRAKVVAECTLKESAAINQILGRRVKKAPAQTCTGVYKCVCACVLTLLCPTVALAVERGASQILRAGQEREATALPALPRLVSTRQLCEQRTLYRSLVHQRVRLLHSCSLCSDTTTY